LGAGLTVIAVIVPTLNRAHKVQGIIDNLKNTAQEAIPYFVVEQHDVDTLRAIGLAGGNYIINKRAPSYAGAVNTALEQTTEPYLFVSADDFFYHPGWLEPLLLQSKTHGLCASNDLHNQDVQAGELATCFLITREYAQVACIDEPGVMLHEGYTHNFVDAEVSETAIMRGQFCYCPESKVEHQHYLWGLAVKDATYDKTLVHHAQDEALFLERRKLWQK
jgi:glycosyltransferase involved in cell wall biosynthesis